MLSGNTTCEDRGNVYIQTVFSLYFQLQPGRVEAARSLLLPRNWTRPWLNKWLPAWEQTENVTCITHLKATLKCCLHTSVFNNAALIMRSFTLNLDSRWTCKPYRFNLLANTKLLQLFHLNQCILYVGSCRNTLIPRKALGGNYSFILKLAGTKFSEIVLKINFTA